MTSDGRLLQWKWPTVLPVPGLPKVLAMEVPVTTDQYQYFLFDVARATGQIRKIPAYPHGPGMTPIVNISALDICAGPDHHISFLDWLNQLSYDTGFFEKHPLLGNNPNWQDGDERQYPHDWRESPMYTYRDGAIHLNDKAALDYDDPNYLRGWRLPYEAEWIAMAGDIEDLIKKSQDAGLSGLDEFAWYAGNSGNKAHEVGLKKPNSAGFKDVLGNVWEPTMENKKK